MSQTDELRNIKGGLKYLEGFTWDQISREERSYCARLYEIIRRDPGEFLGKLIEKEGRNTINESDDSCRFEKVGFKWVNSDMEILRKNANANWEVGFEVCFYRDMYHYFDDNSEVGKSVRKIVVNEDQKYKSILKRTFDLCFMSDDCFIIFEAKAYQGFTCHQLRDVEKDRNFISKITGISQENVLVIGLMSSRYQMSRKCPERDGLPQKHSKEFFDGLLRWKCLAQIYNEPFFNLADEIYGVKRPSRNRLNHISPTNQRG